MRDSSVLFVDNTTAFAAQKFSCKEIQVFQQLVLNQKKKKMQHHPYRPGTLQKMIAGVPTRYPTRGTRAAPMELDMVPESPDRERGAPGPPLAATNSNPDKRFKRMVWPIRFGGRLGRDRQKDGTGGFSGRTQLIRQKFWMKSFECCLLSHVGHMCSWPTYKSSSSHPHARLGRLGQIYGRE